MDVTDSIQVVYVDPDHDTAASVTTIFERECPVIGARTVANADKAFDCLADTHIDCVVSAYDLPTMNGPAFLSQLRSEYPNLPCFLVTDRDTDTVRDEIRSINVTGYARTSDPGQPAALAHRIERTVTTQRTATQLPRDNVHLQALTRATSAAIITIDDENTIRFVNDVATEMFGYSADELLGNSLTLLMSDRYADQHTAGLQQYLRTGTHQFDKDYIEVTGRHKAGHEMSLRVSFNAFHHDGQQFVTGIVRDITERERLQTELDEILARITDAFYAVDTNWRFTYVNEQAEALIDRTEEELLGTTLWEAFPEAAEDPTIYDAHHRSMETGEPVAFEVYYSPLETWFAVNMYSSATGQSVYFRDITDRKRREEQLAALNEVSQELMEAETMQAVSDRTVEAARETLDLPFTMIKLYDNDSGRLQSTARTSAVTDLVDDDSLFASERGIPWEVFTTTERAVHDDLLEQTAISEAETALRSAIILPLDTHGVFISGATDTNAFSETDVTLATILAANTTSALDRVDRERTLREQKDTLERNNERLERVYRLNEVIRGISQELIQASTREEVLQAVCDRLAAAEPYRFVWIGTHDAVTDDITPAASAGVEEGYLETITVTADDAPTGQGPTGKAARAHEPHVQNDIYSDPPFEPWRQAALERGYQASIAVPLVHQSTLYGVLNLYAGQSGVFNEMERAVLAELGEIIGYGLSALERRQALVSDRSVDLEFRIRQPDDPVLDFVIEHDCEFDIENIVQRTPNTLQVFCTIRGVSPASVHQISETVHDITAMRLIREQDDECLVEWTLRESTLVATLVDRGAMAQTIIADDGDGRAVVRIPQTADIRSFVELFERRYDDVELVARRERDEPITTQQEFEAEFTELLTDRQQDIIQTAYITGFFEWPRDSTAQDLADGLGVSQPTVSRHIRAGERTLFGLLFDDE